VGLSLSRADLYVTIPPGVVSHKSYFPGSAAARPESHPTRRPFPELDLVPQSSASAGKFPCLLLRKSQFTPATSYPRPQQNLALARPTFAECVRSPETGPDS